MRDFFWIWPATASLQKTMPDSIIQTTHTKEAIDIYKSRDASEKLFRSDKSYLGNKSMRVCSEEALSSKIFIQFIALILRSRIYVFH